MKKTEFPTFLNEQPTIVFGRTMRELLVILVGIGVAYAVWRNLGVLLPGSGFGILLFKSFWIILILGATGAVSLVKVASRPLEEWALVGFFYYCTPKVFLYMPVDNDDTLNGPDNSPRQHQVKEPDEDD